MSSEWTNLGLESWLCHFLLCDLGQVILPHGGLNFLIYKMRINLSVLGLSWRLNEIRYAMFITRGLCGRCISKKCGLPTLVVLNQLLIKFKWSYIKCWPEIAVPAKHHPVKKHLGQLSVNCNFHCYNYAIINHHCKTTKAPKPMLLKLLNTVITWLSRSWPPIPLGQQQKPL